MHPPFAFKVMCMKKQDAELRQQEMLEKPVERLIVRMGLPTMASMLLSSLYNLVDTYFVSQINTSASRGRRCGISITGADTGCIPGAGYWRR